MRRVLPFAIVGGCLVVGVLPALAADQDVGIRNYAFTPARVAVLPGESVHWAVEAGYGGAPHNVHLEGEADPIGAPSTTFSGAHRFDAEGTYRYYCDNHASMRGTVYVNATGTVPATSPTPSPTASPTSSPGSGGSGGGGTPGGGGSTSDPTPPGSTTAPRAVSFRVRAAVRRRAVFLTLRLGAREAMRVRGTLRRGGRRVRGVTLLARPGRHRVRLPGKALKPGRYTLTLRVGELKRTVRFRVRR